MSTRPRSTWPSLRGTSFPPGVEVETHVHTAEVSDVARSIVEHSDELEPDLIVMCTHGRSGPRDFMFGTIAQQVIALGATPVLLIRPEFQERKPGFLRGPVLVPLDRHPDHARCLPLAVELAKPFGARIHLLSVIPTVGTLSGHEAATGRLLPTATRVILDLDEENALAYLEDQAEALRKDQVEVDASVVRGRSGQQDHRGRRRATCRADRHGRPRHGRKSSLLGAQRPAEGVRPKQDPRALGPHSRPIAPRRIGTGSITTRNGTWVGASTERRTSGSLCTASPAKSIRRKRMGSPRG